MCSNCSGDDPRPESFTSFVISSPNGASIFAPAPRHKQKKYRTLRFFQKMINAALTQAIVSSRRKPSRSEIIESVDQENFVNLNFDKYRADIGSESVSAPAVGHPIDIRVSPGEIIEVYAASESAITSRNKNEALKERAFPWEESCKARNETKRTIEAYHLAHRLKYFLGYGAFVAAAALLLWYAAS